MLNLIGPTQWYADNIGQGSALEMCYYLGKLQEEHYLLSKAPKRKGEVDIMIKVPMLGYAVLSSAFSIGICRKSRVFSFVVTY